MFAFRSLAAAVAAAALLPAARADHFVRKDVVQTAADAGFRTLVAAVEAAGLTRTLKDVDSVTIFAPTDAAFAKLPKGTVEALLKPENKRKLDGILRRHVVSGRVPAADLVKKSEVVTAGRGDVAVRFTSEGKLKLDGATVVKFDVPAANGVIHVIDSVLLPPDEEHPAPAPLPDLLETAVAAGTFKTLLAAVDAAGLTETLKSNGPFTLFAPTDAAFAKLPIGTVEALLEPKNKEKLVILLKRHVVRDRVTAAELVGQKEVVTTRCRAVPVGVAKDGRLTVGGARLVRPDVPAGNGVIHVIGDVIRE